jgi:hypothetical protein
MPKYDGRLQAPAHLDQVFLHRNGKVKGTIRLKPGRVLWSVNRGKSWYSVSLRDFAAWIKERGRRVKM